MVSLFTVMIEELVHELCGGETGEPGKAKKNWEWVRSGSAGSGNWELETENIVEGGWNMNIVKQAWHGMVGRRCNGSGREEREGEGRLVTCRGRFRFPPRQGVARRRLGIQAGRHGRKWSSRACALSRIMIHCNLCV